MKILSAAALVILSLGSLAAQEREVPIPGEGTETREPEGGEYNRTPAKALSSFCSLMPMVKPVRIPPAGSGDIFVVMSLHSDNVIQVGAPFKVTYERRQGPVTLGDWELKPAPLGTLYPVFKGKPIYENTATVRIPASVAPNTKYGKYRVALNVMAEISDGKGGGMLGRFQEDVKFELTVGRPVPRPGVRRVPRSSRVETAPPEQPPAAVVAKGDAGFELEVSGVKRLFPGGSVTLRVRLVIPDGKSIVRDRDAKLPALTVGGLGGIDVVRGVLPKPLRKRIAGKDFDFYRGAFEQNLVLRAPADFAGGERTADVELRFAVCEDDGVCHAPTSIRARVGIELAALGVVAEAGGATPQPTGDDGGIGDDQLDTEGSDSLLFLGAGAALVLVVVLLMMMRKRG